MKRLSLHVAGRLLAVLGLMLLALGGVGHAAASPLNAGDLPNGMAGVTWQLQSMQTAPPAVTRPMEQGITITLVFDGKGGLTGEGACNSYFAGYKVGSDNAITIGPIGSTQKACAENLMNLDQEYFGALQPTSKYSHFQGHLGFSTNNGAGTLNYISATAPTAPGMPTTGNGTESLPLFVAVLSAGLIAAGLIFNRRQRKLASLRIRTRR